jgi:hypothetical protein
MKIVKTIYGMTNDFDMYCQGENTFLEQITEPYLIDLKKEYNFVPLGYIESYDHYSALKRIGVENVDEIIEKYQYIGWKTEFRHTSVIPMYILTKNLSKYSTFAYENLIKDQEYIKFFPMIDSIEDYLNPIEKSMIGTGYTYVTQPNDGFSDLRFAIMNTDSIDGDKILCITRVWFNK